jgi:thymidylate synthase (FAD)
MNKRIKVLDHGFVELIDSMGNDSAIEQAARVSYTGVREEERTFKQTRDLLRYLMRNRHTSTFEMVELKFAARMPMFVARQWVRHRTASINEVSGRYAVLPDECYVPDLERITLQSEDNKQGSSDVMMDSPHDWQRGFLTESKYAHESYRKRVDRGMSKELARVNLPLSTYTEWYWKIDLHNLFHFLDLRLDSHAQYEIRVFAEAIAELIKPLVPVAYEAFEDYILNSHTFSRMEMEILRKIITDHEIDFSMREGYCSSMAHQLGMTVREIDEFKKALKV